MASSAQSPVVPDASELATKYAAAIKDKVVLVTGVSKGGLGAEFVTTIAPHKPKLIILAGRNEQKIRETQEAIKGQCDSRPLLVSFDSLESVRKAAQEVLAYEEASIDVLVNNASIMAGPYRKSPEGLELQFATNYVGPWLFTSLIMPKVLASSSPRIVNVSSDGHRFSQIRFDDLHFDDGKSYNQWRAYGQSKTAAMLYSQSLAQKYAKHPNFVAFAIHPGVIATNLSSNQGLSEPDFIELNTLDKAMGNRHGWGGLQFISLQQGTAAYILAAFDDEQIPKHNGGYSETINVFEPEQIPAWARDPLEAERLWKWTEAFVGAK